MKTYALTTLGCKVNQYEGDEIRAQLGDIEQVPFSQPADLYIINTCSVTAEAEAKARQLIGRAKRAAKDATIILTGCWRAEEESSLRGLGVSLFFTNAEKNQIGNQLPIIPRLTVDKKWSRARLFLKVQDGCDEHCSYCAIPGFRGELKSREQTEVIDEINESIAAGVHEVVLTGIHLGKYGVDRGGKPRLVELIERILSQTKLTRLRLSSIEPQEISDTLIDLMAADSRLARHLHIPMQSGNDKILALMRRAFTVKDHLALFARIRSRIPEIGLSTDIIVGFPGETDDDFDDTVSVVKAAQFSRVHVFKFSARPNTTALKLPDQVNPQIRKTRSATLRGLVEKLGADFTASFVGKEVFVLIERQKNGRQVGLTSEYIRVEFKQAHDTGGDIVKALGVGVEKQILLVKEKK